MTTVHLVYPHSPRISCPDAIGRNLGERLEQHYQVAYYDWDDCRVIKPETGDILLGHPHPAPWTCFRRSLSQPGWRRVLAMSPYHHGDHVQVAFLDSLIERCDLYLAITGNYWFSSVETSPFAHWRSKMVHLDLALDRQDFPVIKTGFNASGCRRFIYVGHSGWTKNTSYLSEIARALPETQIGWLGRHRQPIPGILYLGFQDFSTETGRQMIASYDFMITVGKADANPATVLEAMAWGLIPVCTPQSGYSGYPGIVNIPLGDAREAVAILRQLQNLPDTALREMQTTNWQALDTHFNWNRFTQQVIAAMESDACPEIEPVSPLRRLYIRWAATVSPYSPWRPLNLVRYLVHGLRRRGIHPGQAALIGPGGDSPLCL